MSTTDTNQVQSLLDELISVARDRAVRRVATRMRARLDSLSMEEVLEKVPGKTIIAKAKHLGVSRQTIYAWLDGTMRPNRKRAKQLARTTGFSVAEIRGDLV